MTKKHREIKVEDLENMDNEEIIFTHIMSNINTVYIRELIDFIRNESINNKKHNAIVIIKSCLVSLLVSLYRTLSHITSDSKTTESLIKEIFDTYDQIIKEEKEDE